MTEKALAARRAYKRRWAKENPDKIRAQQERFWSKKAEQAEAAAALKTDPETDREQADAAAE